MPSGLSFQSIDPTPTVQLIGGAVCGSTAWTSATQLACISPAAYGHRLGVYVSIGSVVGTLPSVFTFDGMVH